MKRRLQEATPSVWPTELLFCSPAEYPFPCPTEPPFLTPVQLSLKTRLQEASVLSLSLSLSIQRLLASFGCSWELLFFSPSHLSLRPLATLPLACGTCLNLNASLLNLVPFIHSPFPPAINYFTNYFSNGLMSLQWPCSKTNMLPCNNQPPVQLFLSQKILATVMVTKQ